MIRVSNVEAARDFFTRAAGLTLSTTSVHHDPNVVALELEGMPVLLVGDAANDPAPLLAGALAVYKPGATLSQRHADLDAEADRLSSLGYTRLTRKQTSWGDDVLSVRGPDDYVVEFVHRPERTPAAWVDLYARAAGAGRRARRPLRDRLRSEAGERSVEYPPDRSPPRRG